MWFVWSLMVIRHWPTLGVCASRSIGATANSLSAAPQAIDLPSGLRQGRQPGMFKLMIFLPFASMSRMAWPSPMPPCTVAAIHFPLGAKLGL